MTIERFVKRKIVCYAKFDRHECRSRTHRVPNSPAFGRFLPHPRRSSDPETRRNPWPRYRNPTLREATPAHVWSCHRRSSCLRRVRPAGMPPMRPMRVPRNPTIVHRRHCHRASSYREKVRMLTNSRSRRAVSFEASWHQFVTRKLTRVSAVGAAFG